MTSESIGNTSTGAGRVGVIVVAAGSGSRLGAGSPKALVPLAGQPLLEHALGGVFACPGLTAVVVVAPPGHQAEVETVCRDAASRGATTASAHSTSVHRPSPLRAVETSVVSGGAERGDSVAAGLAALPADVEIVLVHDAARCLTPPSVFERVVAAITAGAVAVVPGLLVVDTVKAVDAAGLVVATPDRATLRAIQTPQGFRRDVLERAHAARGDATDDAMLVEDLGEPVLVVAGDPLAFKVTLPADLDSAARLLAH